MFLMKFLFFFLNDNCANCGQGLYSPAAALCQQNICSCGLRLKKNRNIRFYQDLTIFACFAQLCPAFKAVDLISRHLITKAVSIRSSLQFANAQKRFCLPKLSKRQRLIFFPFRVLATLETLSSAPASSSLWRFRGHQQVQTVKALFGTITQRE